MLATDDLILLPFTPDLTQAGIDYICRSFTHTGDSQNATPRQWQCAVADKAVELAFRRLLNELEVPYTTAWNTPFSDPGRSDIALGGHRCQLSCNHVWHKGTIRALRRDISGLLAFSGYTPSGKGYAEEHNAADLIVIAFTTGLVTSSPQDLQRALARRQPAHLIHALPKSWSIPKGWTSYHPISLESEASYPLMVELGGHGYDREFQCEQVLLLPHTRIQTKRDMYSLSLIHAFQRPDGRIALHTPRQKQPYLIPASRWENIWVYGLDIIFAGYLLYGELCQRTGERASAYRQADLSGAHPGSHRRKDRVFPIKFARPLGELFRQVKNWDCG